MNDMCPPHNEELTGKIAIMGGLLEALEIIRDRSDHAKTETEADQADTAFTCVFDRVQKLQIEMSELAS